MRYLSLIVICASTLLFKVLPAPAVKTGDAQKAEFTNRPNSGPKRPHIIVIVADDLGYNDVSFHGSDQIPTPNIDFLAYNGVILDNYYVSPICTPTRSALMTGRHPIHTGLQHGVITGTEPYGLPLNETLLPQYLNKLGYRSHMVGKWHLGFYKWQYTPSFRGFESHLGYYQGCDDYYTHTYEKQLDQWGLDFRRGKTLLRNCTGLYSTTMFRDEAVTIINNHKSAEPLFLYLPFQAVHSGNKDGPHLQAPESYIEKFSYIKNKERRTYAAMLSALDDAVGDVYDALKRKKMLENSIILFTTDNGGPPNGFDYNAANNFPLRGGKETLWEGGVRGVGLVHSPLLQHQGYVSDKMLHVCDWLPTLVSVAGGKHLLEKTSTSLDGLDAWKMLSENGPAVRDELLHNIDPAKQVAALRVGDYKLLVGHANMKWDGWYPPYQLAGDEVNLHYLNFRGDLTNREPRETTQYRKLLGNLYRSMWPGAVGERMLRLYSFAERSDLYTGQFARLASDEPPGSKGDLTVNKPSSLPLYDGDLNNSEFVERQTRTEGLKVPKSGIRLFGGNPVRVNCGPKPTNASTNCQPTVSSCLYHIPSDPCEYNNIARQKNDIVTKMLSRLKDYASTMVPMGNKPFDPMGNPRLHNGAWVPWRN